jgi:biopolymer transport protein ExbB/TolQ
LYKWLGLAFVRKPSKRRIKALLDAIAREDKGLAAQNAKAVGGPVGQMLAAGVEHLGEPRELIEEVMYETVLATRLKLQRLLPFIAICAASAPLLGLLGTVTGIISTFKLITLFGSGDVKTLSGGISEALITTEFGLMVAIPSLLLHAFLSRKARGVINQMEKAAVAMVNQISRTISARRTAEMKSGTLDTAWMSLQADGVRPPTKEQVQEALRELLVPMLKETLDTELRQRRTTRSVTIGPESTPRQPEVVTVRQDQPDPVDV